MLNKRVIFSSFSNWFLVSDRVHNIDTWSRISKPVAFAFENVLVAHSMQIRKSSGEFDFFIIHGNAPKSSFTFFLCLFRQMFSVDAQKPADTGVFELQEAGSAVGFAQMHHIFFGRAEDPGEHIEEMYTDIGGYASAFFQIAFPGTVVPGTAGGDVGEVYIIAVGCWLLASSASTFCLRAMMAGWCRSWRMV